MVQSWNEDYRYKAKELGRLEQETSIPSVTKKTTLSPTDEEIKRVSSQPVNIALGYNSCDV
jgi:hypothetical protein